MAYSARILCDSVNPSGDRLTTFELTYPRFVHSEFMTHRVFSRNSASSRAIPIEKMLQRVIEDPVMPVWWGKKQSGMQAKEELDTQAKEAAIISWLAARDRAVESARELISVGLHKQIVNRLLEPWMWITVIASTTNVEHFFSLRCHPDAQPEIQAIAFMARDAYDASTPVKRLAGEWHLPLVREEERSEFDTQGLIKLSTGRCARVSYLTHDGRRDPQEDFRLHDRLVSSGHWSPFEHIAMALPSSERSGNFVGWDQYRKRFEHEFVTKRAA